MTIAHLFDREARTADSRSISASPGERPPRGTLAPAASRGHGNTTHLIAFVHHPNGTNTSQSAKQERDSYTGRASRVVFLEANKVRLKHPPVLGLWLIDVLVQVWHFELNEPFCELP